MDIKDIKIGMRVKRTGITSDWVVHGHEYTVDSITEHGSIRLKSVTGLYTPSKFEPVPSPESNAGAYYVTTLEQAEYVVSKLIAEGFTHCASLSGLANDAYRSYGENTVIYAETGVRGHSIGKVSYGSVSFHEECIKDSTRSLGKLPIYHVKVKPVEYEFILQQTETIDIDGITYNKADVMARLAELKPVAK